MGSMYKSRCDECGYEASTSGPWEFYRNRRGKMKPYGHPVPTSREAAENGISGLYGTLMCLDCGKVFDAVLLELEEPFRGQFFWIYLSELKAKQDMDEPVCPDCGSERLMLDPDMYEGRPPCPRCSSRMDVVFRAIS